jgi:hypothetical protein
VQRERDQADAAVRVEAAHGLHQADVALLDQVGLRQSVADVIARHGHHETQVGQHQRASGIDVIVFLKAPPERGFLFLRQEREPVDRLDVMIEASQRSRGGESQRRTRHSASPSEGAAMAGSDIPALPSEVILALETIEC